MKKNHCTRQVNAKYSHALKIPRFMRITLLLVFLVLFQLKAESTYSQSIKLSLDKNNVSIADVLEEIEKNSEYSFLYNNKIVDVTRKVSLSAKSMPVSNILDELFEGTEVSYKMIEKQIILSLKATAAVQQDNSIAGIVRDENGEAIIGASIVVKGTPKGTISDLDGKFSIPVPKNGSVIVSYIGYISQTINVGNAANIDVVLKENTQVLSELVVTALGIKRSEKALGYAVQKVGGEELSIVKGVDVASSLTGKIAGLSINNSAEISEKPDLQLRGENPLIVIDGIAYNNMTLSDISAEDIESIDVLKGATASALYGVRGRAGAVMVTTKKSGKPGTLTVNFSNNTMFSAGYLKMPKAQSSYSTGNYGKLEYNSGNVWGDYMDGHEVEQYDPFSKELKMMPLVSKGGNNISNFLRPSLLTNTNVNIAQSGELGGFRMSATQIHQNGQYPNTTLDKYIVVGSGNINYGKFKLDASFSYKKEKAPNFPKVDYGNGNILYNMLIWGGTEYDVRDFKDYWKIKDQKQNWAFDTWYDNPYYIVNERINQWDKNIFNTSVNLNYEIAKNVSAIFRSGFDNYNNGEENRQSVGDSGQKRGYYGYNSFNGSSLSNDFILNGTFKLDDFGFDLIGGASSFWYKNTSLRANTRGGISVPGFYSLNASVERPAVSKSIDEKALYSIYGKAGISWRSGVYIDVTARNDWSSTLPSESRSYFYPSFATSFIPTAFYNPIENILDFWKIRGSWTIAKKDLNVYELNRIFNVDLDVWDGMSSANYPTKLRDPNVKPETESSYEIGSDIRLFKNRLGFDMTYFTRLRSDRLIESSVSASSGFGKVITNTQEELSQKGMEFTLRGKPIVTKNFTWETSFNGAFWHWYYHKLDPIYSSKDPRKGKGERFDSYFMTDWETDHDGNIVHQAGLPVKNKYQTVMGNKDPSFILGFSNNFKYKNFDLAISMDGRIGGLMYSWTEQAMWQSGVHPDSDNEWRYDEVVNKKQNYIGQGVKVINGSASYDPYGNMIEDTRVFAPNDVAVSYQGHTTVYNENPWDHDARQNIKNATFIKLREIGLNYTLPNELAQKARMKNVRIGVIGQNLLIWTKDFKFSDPDRGRENLNTPTSRYIGLNINVTL